MMKVPRCLRFGPDDVVLPETIHTVVDALQDAYGAVVYLRVIYESGPVSSRLVETKTVNCSSCGDKNTSFRTDGSNPGTKSLQWCIGSSSLLIR